MIRPPLTKNDVSTLRYHFSRLWQDGLTLSGGIAKVWYDVVMDHLERTGCDLITKEIYQLEGQVIRRGLAKEYLASLLESYEELGDEAQLLALTVATSEERLIGLKKVIRAHPELSLELPRYLRLVK